jgi:hypothetical protein
MFLSGKKPWVNTDLSEILPLPHPLGRVVPREGDGGAVMDPNVTAHDRKILYDLAEYRVLTVEQLCALEARNRRATQRRLKVLTEAGLIQATVPRYSRRKGRPEQLVSLAPGGWSLVQQDEKAFRRISFDQVSLQSLGSLDHQLLVNWFRIHLADLPHIHPSLAVEFLSPDSLGSGQPGIAAEVPAGGSSKEMWKFIPDGVVSIAEKTQPKRLLFFLEADLGTESLASPDVRGGDIRQKILCYRQYFRTGGYQRYEGYWRTSFRGFRLLFLTHTAARMTAISNLVRQMPPAEFIWITSADELFNQGLSGPIWSRGGRIDGPRLSILGPTLGRSAPLAELCS